MLFYLFSAGCMAADGLIRHNDTCGWMSGQKGQTGHSHDNACRDEGCFGDYYAALIAVILYTSILSHGFWREPEARVRNQNLSLREHPIRHIQFANAVI